MDGEQSRALATAFQCAMCSEPIEVVFTGHWRSGQIYVNETDCAKCGFIHRVSTNLRAWSRSEVEKGI